MDDPTYGEPLFGFLADFRERIEGLEDRNAELHEENDRLGRHLNSMNHTCTGLRAEIRKRAEDRRTERDKLVEWLDRRIAQQEEAMKPYVSGETRRVVEIELSILKRYREIIVGSTHTQGNDDAFMPRFE